jgi:hypothetical protein
VFSGFFDFRSFHFSIFSFVLSCRNLNIFCFTLPSCPYYDMGQTRHTTSTSSGGGSKTLRSARKKVPALPKPKGKVQPPKRKVPKQPAKRKAPTRAVPVLTRRPGQRGVTLAAKAPAVAVAQLPVAAVSMSRMMRDGTSSDAGVGRMNKAGTALERILPEHKNLRPDVQASSMPAERRVEKYLQKNMKAEDLMSPDGVRYTKLLDEPLTAPWGDQGEVQVRPLIYDETVPPSTTKTVRAFGQTDILVPNKMACWVVFCVGAGNIATFDEADGDDLDSAWPNRMGPAVVAPPAPSTYLVTLGAPPDGRTLLYDASGGDGVAGYYYFQDLDAEAPSIDTAVSVAGAERFPLAWGSPVPAPDMGTDDSAQYKYRPVAGGILITPNDTTFAVGGHYDAMVIPQATNEPYVSAGNPELGQSSNAADILALPDHCIQRADAAISVNWLPGRADYSFLKTTFSRDALALTGSTVDAVNARVFIRISPPTGQDHSFVLSYSGFFELSGRCVQQVGSVPRAQPSLGAKVATAVQNNLNIELDDRSRQITEGTTLEMMKDHPKIGPMIEGCDSMPKAKSTLSSVIEFGKDLLPLVGMFL